MTQNSVIFLLTSHDTVVLSNSYIIAVVKDIDQFSQSIARQKNKGYLQLKAIMEV